jgi:hypothetical protein
MSKRSRNKPQLKPPLVVGFVCEGSTDVVVLRRVVEKILGEIDSRPLQPEVDALDRQIPRGRSGWSEVRAWCQRVNSFDDYFDPDVGDPLDLLVVAVDLDIAINAGLQKRPTNLSAYDATELCKIIKSWLPTPLPGRVIITIPVMATEAWILAAMFPHLSDLESEANPAGILVEKGKIQIQRNGPWKRASEYRHFAEVVTNKLKRVREECREANRFVKKLERIVTTLSR